MNRKERFEMIRKEKKFSTNDAVLLKMGECLGVDKYNYQKRKKANFSKKIKGERKFNEEEIIALEKLFNMKFVNIIEESTDKEDPSYDPYCIKYVAYHDDIKKLHEFLARYGEDVLFGFDEFEKTFIDYIVEYKSYNCLKELTNIFNPTYEVLSHSLACNKPLYSTEKDRIRKIFDLIIEQDDEQTFNIIFNAYSQMQYLTGNYNLKCLYQDNYFYERILTTNKIINSIISYKEVDKDGHSKIYCINPLCLFLLKYMLNNFYKHNTKYQAYLSKMVEVNKEVVEKLSLVKCNYTLENLSLTYFKNQQGLILYYDEKIYQTLPDYIRNLIDKLNEPVNVLIYKESNNMFFKNTIHDGKIHTESSGNKIQYQMMEQFNKIKYKGIPILCYKERNGLDITEYFENTIIFNQNANERYKEIGIFLKDFHDQCKEFLKSNQVYLHNRLFDDVYNFKENVTIINWEHCTIGNYIEDVVDVIVSCANLSMYYNDDKFILNVIKSFIEGYSLKVDNLSNVVVKVIEEKLNRLNKDDKDYPRIYRKYKETLILVDLYKDKINEFTNE